MTILPFCNLGERIQKLWSILLYLDSRGQSNTTKLHKQWKLVELHDSRLMHSCWNEKFGKKDWQDANMFKELKKWRNQQYESVSHETKCCVPISPKNFAERPFWIPSFFLGPKVMVTGMRWCRYQLMGGISYRQSAFTPWSSSWYFLGIGIG